MSEVWKPAVAVAAIIERDGRFLLVEEDTEEGIRYNQPAGHLEPGESLEQAVVRETLEETAHEFAPEALVGMYMMRYHRPEGELASTFIRFAFTGALGRKHERALDDGIRGTVWMTRDELAACQHMHRSPLTLRCVDDYLAGQRAPLSLLYTQTAIKQGNHR